MPTSRADAARMRLVSQQLIDPLDGVADVVRHLVCAQGQDYPGSSMSLALRTTARSLAAVRTAYDEGRIVRSWPMRGTLFVVAAEDLGWIGALTADRTHRATAHRRDQLGLAPALLDRAESVAREALAGDGLTRAEILARWEDSGIPTDGGRGYHHLFHLAVAGVICQGPTAGREQRFVHTQEWIAAPRNLDREESIRELARRYIHARGPVPLEDFCWWSKLGKTETRPHLADLSAAGEIVATRVEDRAYWMAPDLPERYAARRRVTAAPLLLPGFDEIVLGYGDRRAVLTPEQEQLVVPGRNGVFKGTVIHRGQAVGTWKKATRAGAPVDVVPFGTLPASVASALARLTDRLPR